MRSASRNICSTSWETSKMVVPCSRRLVMSPSTWAVSVTPRDAVGSSRMSSCGFQLIARATASNWRCPRERVRTPREGSSSGIPRARRMPAADGPLPRVGEQEPAALAPEQDVRGDVQVVAERQILPDHRDPAPQHRRRVGGHRPAGQEYLPGGGRHVTGYAAHERGLARPVLTGQRHQLARPEAQVDVVERPQRPEPGGEPPHGQQRPGSPSGTGGATLAAIADIVALFLASPGQGHRSRSVGCPAGGQAGG